MSAIDRLAIEILTEHGPGRALGWVRNQWGHAGQVKEEGARARDARLLREWHRRHGQTVGERGVW